MGVKKCHLYGILKWPTRGFGPLAGGLRYIQLGRTNSFFSAEASLSFWGVSGQLSAEVKNNMEKLSKKAQVKVKIFYQGDIGRQLQDRPDSMEKDSAQQIFSTAKSWADKFLQMACAQDYSYQTLLDSYPNIPNFPRNQSIPHYTTAGAVAYQLLGDMVKHTELRRTLQLRKMPIPRLTLLTCLTFYYRRSLESRRGP